MITVGYVHWLCYWGINSVVVRTIQALYPETVVGTTLAALQ